MINTQFPNIVNEERNRSAKITSSRILLFGHSRLLNSIVSNHAKQQKICIIFANATHCTYCSEPSKYNPLWNILQLPYIQARICIQQHIFQFPAGRPFFRVTFSPRSNERITVDKETSQLYAILIHISCKRYNDDLPKSVDVDIVDRFRVLS